ncbi:G5 domain-containing protein [Georgenia sp. M64]|uniref:G5 domain-containing protein n=1 Tax=Georgenia sp. M64 TaxID=3120520 RepID=UPI0030E0B2A6
MSAKSPQNPQHTTPASATSVEAPRRRRLGWLALGIVPVLVAGSAVAAQAHKSIDLEINGQSHTLTTFAGSVQGLLDEQGIEVRGHDLLAPAADTALRDGADIVFRTARQVTVDVDGKPEDVWTTAQTQGELVRSMFESGRDVTVAASRSLARDALDLPLVIDGEVDVVADGTTERVTLEGEAYLADALEAAGVEVSRIDRVVIGTAEDGTPEVVVTRVVRGERTEEQPVDFATVERADDALYEGQTKVVQEGQAGVRTLTFSVVTVDGKEVHSAQTGDEVTTAPVDKVIAVGTKERPAPAPAPEPAPAPATSSAPAPAAAPAPSAPAAPTSGVWAALAQCESGGNPTAVSANGLYYGLYQFSLSTWASVGGSGLPSQASPAEQTMRAQTLQARSGWGQWPHCASTLGLL